MNSVSLKCFMLIECRISLLTSMHLLRAVVSYSDWASNTEHLHVVYTTRVFVFSEQDLGF